MLNKDIWKKLAASGKLIAGLVVLRLHPESKRNIFVGLDPLNGHRFLFLKLNHLGLKARQNVASGRGFTLNFAPASSGEVESCLSFELTETAHADVFDSIGNDVLKNVIEARDDEAAFNVFVARIFEWQKFLDQLPEGGLSEQEQQGLYGELWFLREVLFCELSQERAILSWAGPDALTKDFQFSDIAIEVKTTASKQHNRFSITSELQLDSAGVGRLFLFCVLLEKLSAAGLSLPELISLMRADLHAQPDVEAKFSERLVQAGYLDSQSSFYTNRYSARSQHFFDVRDNFPRIVGADLRRGVGDVHYSILLSECEHYAISEEVARKTIRGAK